MIIFHHSINTLPTISHAQMHQDQHEPCNVLNGSNQDKGGGEDFKRIHLYEIHQKPFSIFVWDEAGFGLLVIGECLWGSHLVVSSACWQLCGLSFAFLECCHACTHSSLSTRLAVFVISHPLYHQHQLHPLHIVRPCSNPVQSFVAPWVIFCLLIRTLLTFDTSICCDSGLWSRRWCLVLSGE